MLTPRLSGRLTALWLPSRLLHVIAGGLPLAAAALLWLEPTSSHGPWLWCLAVICWPLPWLRWPSRQTWIDLALAAVWFLIALAPRLYLIDTLPLGLHGDEAQHALVAEAIINQGLGGFFHDHSWGIPVSGFLWQVALTWMVGPGIAAVRIASALAGALTVAVLFLWANTLAGRWAGMTAAGLLLLAHSHLMLSHLGTVNSQAPLMVSLVAWLLTVSWRSGSLTAAALAASAFALTYFSWAGARLVVPLVVVGIGIALFAIGFRRLRAPMAVWGAGTLALLLGPIGFYLKVPDGWTMLSARLDKSILHPTGWDHSLSAVPEKTAASVIQRQISGTLSAFQPGTQGDSSTFYDFARPLVDPMTLLLALIGVLVLIGLRWPARWQWLMPLLIIGLTLVSTSLIVDPPNYHRLALMLPSLMLLAATTLEWLRRQQWWAGLVVSVILLAIGIQNATWFFIDYPREGRGQYAIVLLARVANQASGPVYVVTPDFPFGHEGIRLLDQNRRIQPLPAIPETIDVNASWVAYDPAGLIRLQQQQAQLPGHQLKVYRDNRGQPVFHALELVR